MHQNWRRTILIYRLQLYVEYLTYLCGDQPYLTELVLCKIILCLNWPAITDTSGPISPIQVARYAPIYTARSINFEITV